MSKELEGHGGGGGSSNRAPIEAPDSLRSTAIAHILDLVSEGEIVGFADQANPLRCVYFNETPLQNADGSANFRTVVVESRVGSQTQDPIPGFAGVENELGVSVELKAITPWTRSVTNPNVTSVRVRLSVAGLSRTNSTNGDIGGYEVAYTIQVATNGGPFNTVVTSSFNGKTRSKYERSHRIELPAGTSWQIRVQRTTPDATSSAIVDKTFVESFTEIVDVKLRLPMSAIVGVTIDAEQFNNIPARAYRMRGRIIRVPSNYNPTTRTYSGIWNGTFQTAYSNNPAWVLYDLCTNPRYGLGHILSDNNLDKWGLYAIGRYCDELVPDGFGGTEPRFTCNLYLQRQEDAYKVVMDVCTVFRGIVYAMGSTIVAEGDMPTDPIYTFNQSNVIDGAFTYSGSAKKVRHTVALVSWNDLTDFGRAKIEYVEDSDGIARYGVQSTEVIAVGCTSRGQARRLGKYILLTETAETDLVTFAVGLDGTIPAPGKVVLVADPLRAGRRTGGRVRSATLNSITVDVLPDVVPGDTISAVMPTGLMETRTVASQTGNTITTTANFSAIPVPQSVWLVESATLKAQAFKVISVTEDSEKLTYTITGLQHLAGKFAAVEQNLKLEAPPITDSPQRVLFRPTNLTFDQRDVADNNTTTIVCEMGWTGVVGAVKYNVMYRSNNNSWVDAGNTSGNTFEIYGLTPGKFQFQVTAVNALGIRSAPTFSEEVTVFPNAQTPEYVAFLTTEIGGALTAANAAQATADGKIDSFYQPNAPTVASEGDFWIDTDDQNRLYRYTAGAWVLSRDTGISQAITAAAGAQATADGRIRTYVGATAPSPTPPAGLGDLWYDTANGVLNRWNGSSWSQGVADVTLNQLAGRGVNLVPDEYSLWGSTMLPRIVQFSARGNFSRDAGQSFFGTASLRMECTDAAGDYHVYLGSGTADYFIPVTPGRSYIISAYVRSAQANSNIQIFITSSGSWLGPEFHTSATANQWTRVSTVFTPPANVTAIGLRLDVNQFGRTVWWDGLMIEEQQGTRTTPSPYARGSASRMALNAFAAAATAQSTADGKIDSFYQPNAPTVASEGDFWIDTDDQNRLYVRQGGAWVLARDGGIGQAITAAAGAQATADGRVRTYFQEAQPTPTPPAALGDLWYMPSTQILRRWNGSAWATIGNNDGTVVQTEIFNPSFEQGLTGWTDSIGVGLAGWTTQAGGFTGSNRLVKDGGTLGNTGIFNSSGVIPVTAGERLAVTVGVNPQSPAGSMSFGFAYYNAAGTYIGDGTIGSVNPSGFNTPNQFPVGTIGSGTWRTLRRVETVPANAVGARVAISVHGYTGAGSWWFDNANYEKLPTSIDEVPDGTTFSRIFSQYLANNAPFSFSPGDELIQNWNYEDTVISREVGFYPNGTVLTANWEQSSRSTTFTTGIEFGSGRDSSRCIFIGDAGGAVLPNGSSAEGVVRTIARYPCISGEKYVLTRRLRWDAAGPAIPSGITCVAETGIAYINRDGNEFQYATLGVTNSPGFDTRSTTDPEALPFEIPWGAVNFRVYHRVYILNQSGGTITTPFTYVHARFDNVSVRKIALAGSAPNLLRNASGFRGTTAWHGVDSVFKDEFENYQFSVGARGAGAYAYPHQDTALSVQNEWVTFSGEAVQIGRSGGALWRPYFEFFNGGTYIGGVNHPYDFTIASNPSENSWTRFTLTARTPPNTTTIRCGIAVGNGHSLFRFRRMKLERSPFATPFVDGSDGNWGDELTHPGSGRQIGDQRQIVQSLTTAYGSVRTTSALTATSEGNVSVNAHSVKYGSVTVSYAAVTNAITGLVVGTRYVIYCLDPNYQGGTQQWFAGADPATVMGLGDGVVVAGEITIPSSGTGSGGGGGGGGGAGGGDWCVDAESYLPNGYRAGDVQAGETVMCWDYNSEQPGKTFVHCESNEHALAECVRIKTTSGASVVASTSTPMTLRDGRNVLIGEMLDEDALVRNEQGELRWERVVTVLPVGVRKVSKIKVRQHCYFAGENAGATIATHNPIYKP